MLSERVNSGIINITDDSIREKLVEELDLITYVDIDND